MSSQKPVSRGPWLTLSPIVFWLGVFIVLPLLLVIAVSFLKRDLYGGIKFVWQIDNYLRIFNSTYVLIVLRSVLIALVTTVICLVIGYPFAYWLTRVQARYQPLMLLLVIIPFWTNSLVRTYAWIILLRSEGIINSYLVQAGLISQPLTLLYNNFAVILGMVYTFLPFMILPLYASLEKLDHSLLEAASDLGAGPVKSFVKVMLPLTMPGIVAGSLLVFIPALGIFFIPDLMGGGKYMLLSNLIKNQFLSARDWPFGSALSIFLIAFTLLMVFVYTRFNKNKGAGDLL